jgi:hypothetical protein
MDEGLLQWISEQILYKIQFMAEHFMMLILGKNCTGMLPAKYLPTLLGR